MDDKKSIFRFVFTCNEGVVRWKSSKQSITADSTTEGEYVAASDAAKKLFGFKSSSPNQVLFLPLS